MHHHHQHHPDGNDADDTASKRIGWAFFLNAGFTVIEFIGGWLTNSTAIMADAVHDLGDSLSIGLAWSLNKFAKRDANESYSYGFQRFSLLGALINGVILMVGSFWVLSEAIPRLSEPEMPHAPGMIGLAVIGVVVNGYAVFRLSGGDSLNERILNLHLLEDVLGWAAVLVVAIVLLFLDWPILDPILSIAFTLFICVSVVRNLMETARVFLQATPDRELRAQIHRELAGLDEVASVHHLHLWSLDGQSHVLTAHLTLADVVSHEAQLTLKMEIAARLEDFNLGHSTIEFEFPQEACRDRPAPDVVKGSGA